jgi:hypothetical protein
MNQNSIRKYLQHLPPGLITTFKWLFWFKLGLKFLLLVAFISTTLSSCKDRKDETFIIDYNYDYYPLDSGRYVIYDVDSIRYNYVDPFQNNDTIRYQWMQVVGDTFLDNDGRVSYRIEFYKRYSTSANWFFDRVWYATPTITNLQRVEDDIRFIKLVFPPKEGLSWDGNLYTPKTGLFTYLRNWIYRYRTVDKPYSSNGVNIDKSLTVEHVDEENVIDKMKSVEMYGKGVGMIYKEWTLLNKQDVNSPWSNPNRTNGFSIFMRVNSYGKW